jgi:hypothetical protein
VEYSTASQALCCSCKWGNSRSHIQDLKNDNTGHMKINHLKDNNMIPHYSERLAQRERERERENSF